MKFLWVYSLILVTVLLIQTDGAPQEKEAKNEHEPGNQDGGVQKDEQSQGRKRRRGKSFTIKHNGNRKSQYQVAHSKRPLYIRSYYSYNNNNNNRRYIYQSLGGHQAKPNNRQPRRRVWRKPQIPRPDIENGLNQGGGNKGGYNNGSNKSVNGAEKEKEQREWTKPKIPRPKRYRPKNNRKGSTAGDTRKSVRSQPQASGYVQQSVNKSSLWNRYVQYKRWVWQMQQRKAMTLRQGLNNRRHVGMKSYIAPKWRYYSRRPMQQRNKQRAQTDNQSD